MANSFTLEKEGRVTWSYLLIGRFQGCNLNLHSGLHQRLTPKNDDFRTLASTGLRQGVPAVSGLGITFKIYCAYFVPKSCHPLAHRDGVLIRSILHTAKRTKCDICNYSIQSVPCHGGKEIPWLVISSHTRLFKNYVAWSLFGLYKNLKTPEDLARILPVPSLGNYWVKNGQERM